MEGNNLGLYKLHKPLSLAMQAAPHPSFLVLWLQVALWSTGIWKDAVRQDFGPKGC